MLLVIMTRSLIRLDNTVRTSLNTGLNDKVHDETRVKADVKTNVDDGKELEGIPLVVAISTSSKSIIIANF